MNHSESPIAYKTDREQIINFQWVIYGIHNIRPSNINRISTDLMRFDDVHLLSYFDTSYQRDDGNLPLIINFQETISILHSCAIEITVTVTDLDYRPLYSEDVFVDTKSGSVLNFEIPDILNLFLINSDHILIQCKVTVFFKLSAPLIRSEGKCAYFLTTTNILQPTTPEINSFKLADNSSRQCFRAAEDKLQVNFIRKIVPSSGCQILNMQLYRNDQSALSGVYKLSISNRALLMVTSTFFDLLEEPHKNSFMLVTPNPGVLYVCLQLQPGTERKAKLLATTYICPGVQRTSIWKLANVEKAIANLSPTTDVLFQIGALTIGAHQWVLCEQSEYFYKLFATNKFNKCVINVTNETYETMEQLVRYAYCGFMDISSVNKELFELLSGAKNYQMLDVTKECINIMVTSMRSQEVHLTAILAYQSLHEDELLVQNLVSFVRREYLKKGVCLELIPGLKNNTSHLNYLKKIILNNFSLPLL